MKLINIRLFLFAIMLPCILLLTNGCQSANENPSDQDKELTIAAASNLINAFTEIGKKFEEAHGVKVTFSFGSTGQLTDQIINGAPFDIFASADNKFIEKLRETDKVIPNTIHVYALGQLAVATSNKNQNQIQIESIQDLPKNEFKKIAIANPEHAPYGMAAKQALESAGIWPALQDRIVYGRNISDTLALLETGNVEAAIVALSIIDKDLTYIVIDQTLYNPLEQTMAVISSTTHTELAKEFIDYVNNEGRETMRTYGFIHPEDRQVN